MNKIADSTADQTENMVKDPAKVVQDLMNNPVLKGMNLNEMSPEMIKQFAQLSMQQQPPNNRSAPKSIDEAKNKQYRFWSTQPVPGVNEEIPEDINQAMEPDQPIKSIRSEPYSLPPGFSWCELDLTGDGLQELYVLLKENYVEDDDNMFRFHYQKEFLQWVLLPPGWRKEWHVGVRASQSGKLLAFISAFPTTVSIKGVVKDMVETNFLCVHSKLRGKKVAKVLIQEITRRVNRQGKFQSIYTAGVIISKAIAACQYWHRCLNTKKLIEVQFSSVKRNMTIGRTVKLYRLPENTSIPGIRRMVNKDVGQCHALFTNYLQNFKLHVKMTKNEFKHWFTPRPGIIETWVVPDGPKIVAFLSFYILPSTVVNHPKHSSLDAAYGFYIVPSETYTPHQLMSDALIIANNLELDVFNCLDLMKNKEFLKDLKFGVGDGDLNYYIYNWKCPKIEPEDVAIILQ